MRNIGGNRLNASGWKIVLNVGKEVSSSGWCRIKARVFRSGGARSVGLEEGQMHQRRGCGC